MQVYWTGDGFYSDEECGKFYSGLVWVELSGSADRFTYRERLLGI